MVNPNNPIDKECTNFNKIATEEQWNMRNKVQFSTQKRRKAANRGDKKSKKKNQEHAVRATNSPLLKLDNEESYI